MKVYFLQLLGDELYTLGCSLSRESVEKAKEEIIDNYKRTLNRTPNIWIECCEINENYYDFDP